MTTIEPDNFEEPKLALTMSYIRRIDEIENLIDNGRAADALKSMCTFINRLKISEGEEALLKAREELNKNQIASFIPSKEVQRYFAMINNYLNDTYFADFHRAKPRNTSMPTLKIQTSTPRVNL